jgi:hypothetical protein
VAAQLAASQEELSTMSDDGISLFSEHLTFHILP